MSLILDVLDDLPKPKATELLQEGMETVQEYSASEEREEGRRWRVFRIGDQEHRVDMKAIEPYKKVISHGGQSSVREVRPQRGHRGVEFFLI